TDAAWRMLDDGVSHGFTHFNLDVALAAATLSSHAGAAVEGEWWPVADLESAGLPTVFAKAARAIGSAA
ncbi:MAG: A/G-specific adenine glycosylase, partial [Sphingomonas sp.]